jgi:NTE family protein
MREWGVVGTRRDRSAKTAFVFAVAAVSGAIQVGMLHSLAPHGLRRHGGRLQRSASLNGAFYAGDPTLDGVQRLAAVWRGCAGATSFR